jgi:predicted 2-oxoglutarate/Fe(II)-dependent dioxygenase YbiX
MLTADAFTALGFFAGRGFLDPETCLRLRETVKSARANPVTVRDDESGQEEVDRSSRSTDLAAVAPEAVALVERRLEALIPEISRHYELALTGLQRLQFLVYREGDFFRAHTDGSERDDAPEYLRSRRVAAVVFLNGEGDPATSDSYRGGALTFYGLFDQPEAKGISFPLRAEEGLLMTFPADVVHEVRPIEAGERYSVVTWFEETTGPGVASAE